VLLLHAVEAGVGALRKGLQGRARRPRVRSAGAMHPTSQVLCSGLFLAKHARGTWTSAGGWGLGGLRHCCVGRQVSLENTGVMARQQWAVL